MRLRLIKRVIARTASDAAVNHTLSFAAALSYYVVVAFFPALIALAAMVAYLPIPDLFDTVINTIARVAPSESMGMIRQIVADVILSNRGAFLSFGLIGTLWTCSSGFSTIIEALNVACDIPETRSLWKTRLLATELTFIIGTLVTSAFAFMIVGPRFGEFLSAHLGLRHAFAEAWPVLRYIFAISFLVIGIETLYLLGPNVKRRFTASLPGAMVSVIGWILLSNALSYYFRTFFT